MSNTHSSTSSANTAVEITVRQAAVRLGNTLPYVYQLVWLGKLPARKRGRTWLVPVAAVEARLAEREAQQAA